ncbi:hypothetical protein BO221_02370 [Archangium sp. Cb G35]|uniref:hypothetical protein n=1 Tax=Archangium sp. Cb G35 TaxID=1920190 RepID=UPI0009359633|nr:hypothetical protein [Archangium sp. Cb G35]OJT26880.1 hypothetical protein BO221_02370 [Archangium sp. Cb G35]
MMPRRLLMLVPLLVLETGCPHAWGRGGNIDQALAKDMREYLSNRNCTLEEEEWWEQCGADFWDRPPIEQNVCPLECHPPRPKQ